MANTPTSTFPKSPSRGALGAMFAYLLFPIANYLKKNRFPRILAILNFRDKIKRLRARN